MFYTKTSNVIYELVNEVIV